MKIAKYIPAAALALVLAGCQSEDDFMSSDYANDPMAVHIRAGIEALQTRVNTTGTGDTWETGDLISVANTSTGAVTGKDKAVYKYNGGTWGPEGADYMVWADDVNTFEAYYPVVEGKTDSYTQFELPTDQNSSDPDDDNYIGRADYMTAAASQSKSDALNLTFKHHLTKVTVGQGYRGDKRLRRPVRHTETCIPDSYIHGTYHKDYSRWKDTDRCRQWNDSNRTIQRGHFGRSQTQLHRRPAAGQVYY